MDGTQLALANRNRVTSSASYCRLLSAAVLCLTAVACGTSATIPHPSIIAAVASPSPSPVHLNRAYVATAGGVVPIDLATRTAGSPIPTPTGTFPVDVVIAPNGVMAYVAAIVTTKSHASSSVIPLDLTTNTFGKPIPVSTTTLPFGLGLSNDGKTAYVSTILTGIGGVVIPLDLVTDKLLSPILLPKGTFSVGLALMPTGSKAYLAVDAMASQGINAVIPIDLATHALGVPILSASGTYPVSIAISPDGSRALVTEGAPPQPAKCCNGTAASVVIPIDLATNTPLPQIGNAYGSDLSNNADSAGLVIYAPDGKTAYVTEQDYRGYGTLVIPVDLTTTVPEIKLANPNIMNVSTDGAINSVAITANGQYAFMAVGKYVDAHGKTIGTLNGVIPVGLWTFQMATPITLHSTPFAIDVTP